jgi:hypothetical protein
MSLSTRRREPRRSFHSATAASRLDVAKPRRRKADAQEVLKRALDVRERYMVRKKQSLTMMHKAEKALDGVASDDGTEWRTEITFTPHIPVWLGCTSFEVNRRCNDWYSTEMPSDPTTHGVQLTATGRLPYSSLSCHSTQLGLALRCQSRHGAAHRGCRRGTIDARYGCTFVRP